MRYYSFEVAANSGHTAAMLHSMKQFFCLADHHALAKPRFVVMAVAADVVVLAARAFATRSWANSGSVLAVELSHR